MENHSAQGDVTLVCKNCGAILHGKVSATVTTDIDIAAFNVNIYGICSKCGQISEECGEYMANSISILIHKNYDVLKFDEASYDGLLNPYIKIRRGATKLNPPKGWRDVTGEGVHSFQVFAPIKTYGTASPEENIEDYDAKVKFKTEDDFLVFKLAYIKKLETWAKSLPENTDITTLKNLRGKGEVIDVD